ncbi:hypothetical protein [Streptomyces smyrnaeus]
MAAVLHLAASWSSVKAVGSSAAISPPGWRPGDLMLEGSPAAKALERAMQDERTRKNVRPAEEPPLDVDLDAGTIRIRDDMKGGGDKTMGADGKAATR